MIITSLVEGKPGSSMQVEFVDAGESDHDVFTIEDGAGAMLARFPAAGSDAGDNASETLSFIMPAGGEAYARQYISDYGASYGERLDGGCLRSDLITVKEIPSGGPNPVEGGQTSFSISVENSGPSDASNVALTDQIPGGLVLSGSSVTKGTYNAGSGLWDIGDIPAGQTETLDLTVDIDPGTAGTRITNTAMAANADQRDPATANDVLEAGFTVLSVANLVSSKTVSVHDKSGTGCDLIPGSPSGPPGAAIPGACLEYDISLENTGTESASLAELSNILDTRVTFVTANFSGIDDSDPAFVFSTPSPMTDCSTASCEIRVENGVINGQSTGEVVVRVILN